MVFDFIFVFVLCCIALWFGVLAFGRYKLYKKTQSKTFRKHELKRLSIYGFVSLIFAVLCVTFIIGRFQNRYVAADGGYGDHFEVLICDFKGECSKKAIMNVKGDIITEEYNQIYSNDYIYILKGDEQITLVDKSNPNHIINKTSYEQFAVFEDYIVVDQKLYDSKGNLKVEDIGFDPLYFNSDMVIVRSDNHPYYPQPHFEKYNYTLFNNGYGVFNVNESTHILSGEDFEHVELTKKYDYLEPANKDGLIKVGVNQSGKRKYGYIDVEGNEIIKPEYNKLVQLINGNRIIVKKDGHYGVLDTNGNEIIKPEYNKLVQLINGNRIIVKKDGHYGVLDTNGNEIVNFGEYYFIDAYKNGIALVKKDGLYGYIDTNGNEVIECNYKFAYPFVVGQTIVSEDKTSFSVIDTSGKELGDFQLPFHFGNLKIMMTDSETESNTPTYFNLSSSSNRDWVVVNQKGEFITSSKQYDNVENNHDINYINNKLFVTPKNSNSRVYDLEGNLIKELEHNYGAIEKIGNIAYGYVWDGEGNRRISIINPVSYKETELNYDSVTSIKDGNYILEDNGDLYLYEEDEDTIKEVYKKPWTIKWYEGVNNAKKVFFRLDE